MNDRLVWLLNRFELRAKVFQAGRIDRKSRFGARNGVGYLHVLQSGHLSVADADAGITEIREPTAFFYMNPVAHELTPEGDDVSIVCATFEFGLGEGNPLQRALPERLVMTLADMPALADCLEQLFEEADGDHCGRQAILNRLCEVTLILVLRDLMDNERLDIGLLAGLADPKLAKALNAVHADPAREWSLVSLAHEAGMSRARFAERFREVVGQTPGAYLSDWRLGLAKTMLLKGQSVKTIAGDVGYGSASALSRVFASRCGMSPRRWLGARQRQEDPVDKTGRR